MFKLNIRKFDDLKCKAKIKSDSSNKAYPVEMINFDTKALRLRVRKSGGCDNGTEIRNFDECTLVI